MNGKKFSKEKIIALIARYGHLDRILTIVGVFAVLVLAVAVGIVVWVNSREDKLPANAVYDNDGKLTEVLGDVTVCIDPGHGYDDPGADSQYLGEDLAEREINFAVALKVREILSSYNINVIMTHDTNTPDSSIPQNEDGKYVIDPVWRADFANAQENIELYVSLHCDSYPSSSDVRGTRIYYMPTAAGGKEAGILADKCGDAIEAGVGGGDVSIKSMSSDDAYYVIKHVKVPSVLIEMGFITNPEDAADMLDEEWQYEMALGVANGIINYILK